MKVVVSKKEASIPRKQSFLKLNELFFFLLVLFAAPLTDSMAISIVLSEQGSDQSIDLSVLYRDPGTSFSDASSSNPNAVTVSLNGSILTVTPVAAGTSNISVKVNQTKGNVFYEFTTKVNRRPTGALGGVTFSVGSGAETVNLAASISDPDGDSLTFKATSSHTSRVTTSLNGFLR